MMREDLSLQSYDSAFDLGQCSHAVLCQYYCSRTSLRL